MGHQHEATVSNWRQYSDRCHEYWMDKLNYPIGSDDERKFLGVAIIGEVGELANFVKKQMRDGDDAERRNAIRREIADVAIYLHHIERSWKYREVGAIMPELQWPVRGETELMLSNLASGVAMVAGHCIDGKVKFNPVQAWMLTCKTLDQLADEFNTTVDAAAAQKVGELFGRWPEAYEGSVL